MSAIRVSVIIPVRAVRDRPAALASLHYPVGLGTVEFLLPVGSSPSQQRNAAVRLANSEILYFLDDDSAVSPETLKMMVECFEKLGGAALGGPAITRAGAGLFERCAGEVMASRFGSGVVRARSTPVGKLREVSGEELVSCNLMMRKSWFDRVGGLDEAIYPGEDVDLIKRLRAQSAVMHYHPEAVVRRTRRRTLWQLGYQYYRYAEGRGSRFLNNLQPLDMIFLLPTLLLLYLLFLPLLPKHGLLIYAALALATGAQIGWRLRSLRAGLLSSLLFPVQHLSYGLGMAVGLCGIELRGRGRFVGVERHVLDL
jgi:GT2 family glycosyltransferase